MLKWITWNWLYTNKELFLKMPVNSYITQFELLTSINVIVLIALTNSTNNQLTINNKYYSNLLVILWATTIFVILNSFNWLLYFLISPILESSSSAYLLRTCKWTSSILNEQWHHWLVNETANVTNETHNTVGNRFA